MIGQMFKLGKGVNMFPVEISVDDFMGTNSLVLGQTRSGKTHLTRLLIEKMFGHCSQFIFDREGEYVTLREKYGFVVIGDGWDLDVGPAVASELAVRLVKLGASAIIDLSGMKHKLDLEFVTNFVTGLMSLKLDEQRETMLVFDEVHLLAPEGRETPCSNAVMDVSKRGLKRGLFSVFTTQRLPEIAKGVVNQCNNAFTGRAVDIDAARSAGRLRLNKAQVEQLHTLKRGQFFCAGPAVSDFAIMVQVDDTETHPPNRRQWKDFKLTPPKGAVLEALGELKTIEKEVTEKAQTIEELREQIRELKAKQGADPVELLELRKELAIARLDLQRSEFFRRKTNDAVNKAIEDFRLIVSDPEEEAMEEVKAEVAGVSVNGRGVEIQVAPKKYTEVDSGDKTLSGKALDVMKVVASFYPNTVDKPVIARMAGVKQRVSTFRNALSILRTRGYIEDVGESIRATKAGYKAAGSIESVPSSRSELITFWSGKLSGAALKLFDQLAKGSATRDQLSRSTGIRSDVSTFRNGISILRTSGLIKEDGERFSLAL